MTLQAKIDRYLREVTAQTGGGPARVPPISRLLWGLRLDVPPPRLWPYWVWVLAYAITSMLTFYVVGAILPWHRTSTVTEWAVFGVLFGLFMGRAKLAYYRPVKLSPWYGTPAGYA